MAAGVQLTKDPVGELRRVIRVVGVLVLAFTCACAAPVGVQRISPRKAQRALTANVLSTGELSEKARILLRRTDNEERWEKDPEAVVARLHAALARPANDYDRETRAGYFDAASELCFAHAERTGDQRYYLAAALYAWIYLFPARQEFRALPLDRGRRLAADLYNRSLTLGFTDPESDDVVLREGEYALPFGALAVDLDEQSLEWGRHRLERFSSLADLRVRGLKNRYAASGLGAPLAATIETSEETGEPDVVFSKVRVPVTALLRFDSTQIETELDPGTSRFGAGLSVVAHSEAQSVEIGGSTVPLEVEPSAALALALTESPPWQRELRGFFQGDLALEQGGLLSLAPYRSGRLPVVLVHGTASSAGRWADLVNDLSSDPVIRRNFHLLLFSYNTGNPIAYSGWLLREALEGFATRVDPGGRDAALDNFVVIGHSQGGLLTKLLTVDAGDALWSAVSDVPPDEVVLRDESREILEGSLLVEPLERIDRVVFLSTPHRGSRLANLGPARLLGRLVRSPANVVNAALDLVGGDVDAAAKRRLSGGGALGNMSPNSPFIRALAELPVSGGMHAHSIIGVRKGPKEGGGDGVVAYESAHLDGVDSELIVRSGHSSQSNPNVVREIRRILLEHLTDVRGETPAAEPRREDTHTSRPVASGAPCPFPHPGLSPALSHSPPGCFR